MGCGKSSLLHAIMGEMHRKSGALCITGSVAYTAQVGVLRTQGSHMHKGLSSGVRGCVGMGGVLHI